MRGVLVVRGPDGPGAHISSIFLSCTCFKFIWIYGQKATFGLAMRTVYTDMREGYTRMDARAIRTHGKDIIMFNTVPLQDFEIFQRSRHTQGIRRLVIR